MNRTTRAMARLGTLALVAGVGLSAPFAIGTASATVSGITVTNGTVGSNEAAAARDDYANQAQVTFTKDTSTDNITLTLNSTGAYFPITQTDGNVVTTSATSATCNANVASCTVDIGDAVAEQATLFIADTTDATSKTANVSFNGLFIQGCPGTGIDVSADTNFGNTVGPLTTQNCVSQGQFLQTFTETVHYQTGATAGANQNLALSLAATSNTQFAAVQPPQCTNVLLLIATCITDAQGNVTVNLVNSGTPAQTPEQETLGAATQGTTGAYPPIAALPQAPTELINWDVGGVTPARVNAVGGQVIAPSSQNDTGDAAGAQPGDVIEGVFEVQGSCTPVAPNVTCDNGTRLSGVQVTVEVDHGFITPNCTKAAVKAYEECTFASTPTAGSQVGNLASSGTSATFNTGVDGRFTASFAIGKDAGFDQNGRVVFHVKVAGIAPVNPGDHTNTQNCPSGLNVNPALGGGGSVQDGNGNAIGFPAFGGCQVDGAWTTDQQPLNGGTAKIVVVPALQAPNNTVVPSENNLSAAVGGTTDIPDVDRVVYQIQYTDQFGNLTSNRGSSSPDSATLVKKGAGALYRCSNSFSSTDPCTNAQSNGATNTEADGSITQTFNNFRTQGAYLSTVGQRRWQADSTDPTTFNFNQGYGALAGGAIPGVGDGLQTDTLTWTPPTTTFATFLAGSPAVATYAAGNGAVQTVTIAFNFYNQLAQPVVTFSVKPGNKVQTGTAVTVEANVLDQHGNPIVLQPVQFVRTGANEGSCVPIQDTNGNNAIVTNAQGTSGYTFSCNAAGVSNVSIVVTGPGGIQLAQGREAITFGGANVGSGQKVEKPTLRITAKKRHQLVLHVATHPSLKHVTVHYYKVKHGLKLIVGSAKTGAAGHSHLKLTGLKSGTHPKYTAKVVKLSSKYKSKYAKVRSHKVK